jgi:hypothetical protein
MQLLFESQSAVEQITAKMQTTTGRKPSAGEVRSWNASLPVLIDDLMQFGLHNIAMLFEQHLPPPSKKVESVQAEVQPKIGLSSCVVVELKQWSHAELLNAERVRSDLHAHS